MFPFRCSHRSSEPCPLPPHIDSLPSQIQPFFHKPNDKRNINKLKQHLHCLHQQTSDDIKLTLRSLIHILSGCSCKTEFIMEAGAIESCVRILRRTSLNQGSSFSFDLISFYAATVLGGCFSCVPPSALPRLWETGAVDELIKLAKGTHTWLEERAAIRALFCFTTDERQLRRLAINIGLVTDIIDSLLLTPSRVFVDVFCDPTCSSHRHYNFFLDVFSQSEGYEPPPEVSKDISNAVDGCFIRTHSLEFLIDYREQSLSFLNVMTRDQVTMKGVSTDCLVKYCSYFSKMVFVIPHTWTTVSKKKIDQSLEGIIHQSGVLTFLTCLIRCPATSHDAIKLVSWLLKFNPNHFEPILSSLGVFASLIDPLEGLFAPVTADCLLESGSSSLFWAMYNAKTSGEAALRLLLWLANADRCCLLDPEKMLLNYYHQGYEQLYPGSQNKFRKQFLTFKAQHLSNLPELPNMSPSISKAADLRSKGNNLFRNGDYSSALTLYLQGLWRCPFSETQQRRMFLSNISECCLRLGNYRSAVSYASRGLFLGKGELVEKCLYRRGKAWYHLSRHPPSYFDFLEAGTDSRFKDKVFKSVQDLVCDIRTEDSLLDLYDFSVPNKTIILSILGKTLLQSPMLFNEQENSPSKLFNLLNIEECLTPPPYPELLKFGVYNEKLATREIQKYFETFLDPIFQTLSLLMKDEETEDASQSEESDDWQNDAIDDLMIGDVQELPDLDEDQLSSLSTKLFDGSDQSSFSDGSFQIFLIVFLKYWSQDHQSFND
ncbi:hypothetical protein GEMRC1_001794 [Eukaryota sp. GEM-RC1]